MSLNVNSTYVHNGKEVKLTGRKASKNARSKTIELVEIKPIDVDDVDNRHNTWVKMEDLFIVGGE